MHRSAPGERFGFGGSVIILDLMSILSGSSRVARFDGLELADWQKSKPDTCYKGQDLDSGHSSLNRP